MKRFFKKLFKRGDFMTRADKAYYGHKFKTMFWSVFSLFIISWVGTNLVLCALTTNVHSGGDLIYEVPDPVVLPIGKEMNNKIQNYTTFDSGLMGNNNTKIKTITFDFYTSSADEYIIGGVNLIAGATKAVVNEDVAVYRANGEADIYVLSHKKMQANPDSSYMFFGANECEKYTFNNFDTSLVTNMECMFQAETDEMEGFIIESIGHENDVFSGEVSARGSNSSEKAKTNVLIHAVIDCLDLSGWNTSNVVNMYRMFNHRESILSFKFDGWDTSSVTNMGYMFRDTNPETIDVSAFDTRSVLNMENMFLCRPWTKPTKLKTIYASDRFVVDQVTNSYIMFDIGAKNLAGGNGTKVTSGHTNKEYARIDGGPNSATPGYFTEKPFSGKV